MFRFGKGKWLEEGAYCAKNIQMLLFLTPLVTGIIQFVDM